MLSWATATTPFLGPSGLACTVEMDFIAGPQGTHLVNPLVHLNLALLPCQRPDRQCQLLAAGGREPKALQLPNTTSWMSRKDGFSEGSNSGGFSLLPQGDAVWVLVLFNSVVGNLFFFNHRPYTSEKQRISFYLFIRERNRKHSIHPLFWYNFLGKTLRANILRL